MKDKCGATEDSISKRMLVGLARIVVVGFGEESYQGTVEAMRSQGSNSEWLLAGEACLHSG
jgi:hypothetical protein